MSNVLILTGCAGFIGLNFLKYALGKKIVEDYDAVVSIDKLGYATQYNEEEYRNICLENGIKMLHININELKKSAGTFKDFGECKYDVLNFASESHVDNSIEAPHEIFMENAGIPGNLITVLGIERINKWIQISTDEIYGELPLNAEYEDWFQADGNFHPNNPYSASKASQDMFLMSMQHTFGLNLQFIRLANQFGPWQHPEKMLPVTIIRSLAGDSIKIYGDGSNIRQWTPVRQSVKVIYEQLKNDSTNTVLIAKKYTPLINNNDVVEIWRGILKNKHDIETTTEYIEDRKGHDTMYALQTTEAVDEMFDTTLVAEFEATIDHYVKYKDHYVGLS